MEGSTLSDGCHEVEIKSDEAASSGIGKLEGAEGCDEGKNDRLRKTGSNERKNAKTRDTPALR